jgi:hypothetical protein
MMLNHSDGMILMDGGSAAGFDCVKEGIWETIPNGATDKVKQKKTTIIKNQKDGNYYAITDIRHDNGSTIPAHGTKYTYLFNNRYFGYMPVPCNADAVSDISKSDKCNDCDTLTG